MISKRYSEKHGRKMWGYDIRVNNGRGGSKRIRRYEFETRDQAEQVVSGIRRAERDAKYGITLAINRPKLQELIEKKLRAIQEQVERSRSRRVLYTWLRLIDPHLKLAEDFTPTDKYRCSVRVDEMKTHHLRMYVDQRLADGVANSTINRELTVIASTLNQAGDYFAELEQWKAPKVPRLKVVKSRRERIVTEEEHRRIIAHLRRPPGEDEGEMKRTRTINYRGRLRVAQIFEFAMMSAARHSEITAIKWTDVDWERRKIYIYQTKTLTPKEIPLIPPIERLLNERKKTWKGKYIFSKKGGITQSFYVILGRACQQLGIPYGKNLEDGLVLHTARHTVTTRLVESGLDYDTIGLITGHRAKHLIAHYSHMHPGSVARAAAALETLAIKNDGEKDGEETKEASTKI
jgi:integrase